MKELLQAMRGELRARLPQVRDVFVSPHEAWVPHGVRFPAIGLKDGDVGRRELSGGLIELTLQVSVMVMVQLLHNAEANLLGAAGARGILDLAADVHAALYGNLLLPGVQSAWCPRERASQLLLAEQLNAQGKVLIYEYVMEVER